MTLPNEVSFLDTAGRLLIVIFFLVAGLGNMTRARIRDHIERMAASGMPAAAPAFWFGITLQFTGCALLLAGWHADTGALLLIVFTLAATAIFHRFWQADDPVKRNLGRLFFLNNTAITGGLLLLLANMQQH
jgi:putative oxidoreductase